MENIPLYSRNGQLPRDNLLRLQLSAGKAIKSLFIICLITLFTIVIYNRKNYIFVKDVFRRISLKMENGTGNRDVTGHIADNRILPALSDEVTVVTAYFNIGKFNKGRPDLIFTPSLYYKWFGLFAYIENPLVVFVDNERDAKRFRAVRSGFPENRTRVIILHRNRTRSFGLVPNISEIFSQPGYPRHTPNTVVPEYSAAMNAKYEVVEMAIDDNPFRTAYFCWLDIGLFRELHYDSQLQNFRLHTPPGLRDNAVAYGDVSGRNPGLTARDIIYRNHVWVCGCFFIARWDVMRNWTKEYLNAVDTLVERKLFSTDQQVIYIMANEKLIETDLQIYTNYRHLPDWFHLGYLAREAGQRRENDSARTSLPPRSISTLVFAGKKFRTTPVPTKLRENFVSSWQNSSL